MLTVPRCQAFQVLFQRIKIHAEITVDDSLQLFHRNFHVRFVHLHPDRVLDGILQVGPLLVFGIFHEEIADFNLGCHLVAAEFQTGEQPLFDETDGRAGWQILILGIESPGTEAAGAMLIAGVDHADGWGIVAAEMLLGIDYHLLLLDAVEIAGPGKSVDVIIVTATFKCQSPLLHEILYMGSHQGHGRFLTDARCFLSAATRFSGSLDSSGVVRWSRLCVLQFKVVDIPVRDTDGSSIPVEERLLIMSQPRKAGEVSTLPVSLLPQEHLVEVDSLVKRQLVEVDHRQLAVIRSFVFEEDAQTMTADGAVDAAGVAGKRSFTEDRLQFLLIQPIDVNESQASSPLDVVNLSAFAVKFHGDGDTRSQRFQFIRTFLSDSQALSVGLGKALD